MQAPVGTPAPHAQGRVVEPKATDGIAATAPGSRWDRAAERPSDRLSERTPERAGGKVGRVKRAPNADGLFIKAALRSPMQVGAIAASSRFLARKMVKLAHLERASTVIEYGPGTGAITREILPALPESAKFFAIELNPVMIEALHHNLPGVKVHQRSIADVCDVCELEGLARESSVDVVISGIPWSVVPEDVLHAALAATQRVLRPGGRMLTYGYHSGLLLRSGRLFAKALPKYFRTIRRSRPVWLNLPPAFVYTCEK